MKNFFVQKTSARPLDSRSQADGAWKVLVVDDDAEMHSVTRLILSKVQYAGRDISLLNAHSSIEAQEILQREPGIAVVLLDVVMETDDAGLRLVHYIRKGLGNRATRIILRTGQPGQAPEEKVIVDYDINDYREKTELTSQKLTTSVISALRSYQDIMAVEASRSGLQRIIDTSNTLFRLRDFEAFADGALETFRTFIDGTRGATLIMRESGEKPSLISGPSKCAADDAATLSLLMEALDGKVHRHGNDVALYLPVEDDLEMAAFLCCGRELSEIERALLETLASKIAVGFASVRHIEQLREVNEHLEERVAERTRELELVNLVLENLATVDSLTGVFNRRHFAVLTKREITRARRLERPFSMLMVDIDFFKKVNDTHGHAVGDRALQALIKVCRAELRDIDIICRYGGEEFAILLPETRVADSVRVADRLREAVAAVPISAGEKEFQITISVGVSEWRVDEDTVDAAQSRADAALYAAKHGGRNRVVAY